MFFLFYCFKLNKFSKNQRKEGEAELANLFFVGIELVTRVPMASSASPPEQPVRDRQASQRARHCKSPQ